MISKRSDDAEYQIARLMLGHASEDYIIKIYFTQLKLVHYVSRR